MLNVIKHHPAELIPMLGIDNDLINKYTEPFTTTSKGHMVRVKKNYAQHTATDQSSLIHAKRQKTWYQWNGCTAPPKTKYDLLT
jgi:hypothetical protein